MDVVIMTPEQKFEHAFANGDLDDQYAEFIMENCHGERIIGNGNALVLAMEDLYLYESFKDHCLDEE